MQNKYTHNNQQMQNKQNNNLTIKYLINLLNDQTSLKFTKINYLIDSYPTLKLDSIVSYDTLLSGIMIAYKNIPYKLNNNNFKIFLEEELIKQEKQKIEKFLFASTIESGKKKKYISYINSQANTSAPPLNENILVLTYYYGINLIIYNSDTQTTKCFYYDNYLDKDLPFVIIKESKDQNSPNQFYEISFSQNQYIFNHSHPIISELLPTAFIIGIEQNKRLEYLQSEQKNDENININIGEVDMSNNVSNNVSTDVSQTGVCGTNFTEYKSDKNIIKLKSIPKNIDKLLLELQTQNYEFIH